MYSGQIAFSDGQLALAVYVAADKYDVQSLKHAAEYFISKNISATFIFDAIDINEALNSSRIKTACTLLLEWWKKQIFWLTHG